MCKFLWLLFVLVSSSHFFPPQPWQPLLIPFFNSCWFFCNSSLHDSSLRLFLLKWIENKTAPLYYSLLKELHSGASWVPSYKTLPISLPQEQSFVLFGSPLWLPHHYVESNSSCLISYLLELSFPTISSYSFFLQLSFLMTSPTTLLCMSI